MNTLRDVVVQAARHRDQAIDDRGVEHAFGRQVGEQRTEGNRQEQQGLVLLDDGHVEEHDTNAPHDDHAAGDMHEPGVLGHHRHELLKDSGHGSTSA